MKHTEESKKKMSDIAKKKGFGKWSLGKHHTKETREKMSKALIGNKRALGCKCSEENKKRISSLHKGKKVSKETLKKMSLSSPKVWLGKKFSEEHKKKIGISNLGKKMSADAIRKMKESKRGENHWRWYKDRTKLKKQEDRRTSAVHEWRKNIYERDNWECRINNKECNGRIEAHHILNWVDYPELRYDINNGVTLCKYHHPRGRENEEKLVPKFKKIILKK